MNHERKMVPQAQGANRIMVEPVKNFNELNAKEDFVKHVSSGNASESLMHQPHTGLYL